MFKAEIKKLAAAQVAERQARHAMKASDAVRHRPQLTEYSPTARSYYGMSLDERSRWEEACRASLPYHEWFIASDRRKFTRRQQIRVRHLLDAFHSGVPYKVVESSTRTDPELLAYWLTTALLHLEPGREDRECNDVRRWLGAKPWMDRFPPVPYAGLVKYLGFLPEAAPTQAA